MPRGFALRGKTVEPMPRAELIIRSAPRWRAFFRLAQKGSMPSSGPVSVPFGFDHGTRAINAELHYCASHE
ncbi:hypothetical protein [Caballeronia calidae]|uniref:hypothetical protein n=1 Tax=Caballeronia calidae TaxID=1777139 RepID=UPI000788E905|nr:hypothetical protein [Caballeronia calidae]